MGITEQILTLNPLILIVAVSFIITLISTLAYKFLTNQGRMKELKDGIKKHQDEMKKHKENPKKMMEVQKQAMQKNMEYMSHSFRPMIFTFLPIILIFGWLNGNLAYSPIHPGQEFNVTVMPAADFNFSAMPGLNVTSNEKFDNYVLIKMKGDTGEYTLFFDTPNEKKSITVDITNAQKYANPKNIYKSGNITSITVGNEKMKPFGDKFNIFGYYPGWFAVYFVTTLIFSSVMRKLLRVY